MTTVIVIVIVVIIDLHHQQQWLQAPLVVPAYMASSVRLGIGAGFQAFEGGSESCALYSLDFVERGLGLLFRAAFWVAR